MLSVNSPRGVASRRVEADSQQTPVSAMASNNGTVGAATTTASPQSLSPVVSSLLYYNQLTQVPGARVERRNGSAVVAVEIPESGVSSFSQSPGMIGTADGGAASQQDVTGGSVVEEQLDADPDNNEDNNENNDHEQLRLCRITAMLPSTNQDGDLVRSFGLFSQGATLLAIHHFNTRNPTIVPQMNDMRQCNVKLTLDLVDTQSSPIEANRRFIDDILTRDTPENPKPCAIHGALRSVVSGPLSVLAGIYDVPVISSLSASSQLDDKDKYPYFGRTNPTNRGDAKAAATYLHEVLNVTHVGVLSGRDDYGTSYARAFAEFARGSNMTVVTASYDPNQLSDMPSFQRSLQPLVSSGYNYFFGVLPSSWFEDTIRAMYDVMDGSLLSDGKLWLFSDGAERVLRPGTTALDESIRKGMHGSGIVSLDVAPNPVFDEMWKSLESDVALKEYFVSMQPDTVNLTGFTFSPIATHWEYFAYDAVMALGIAACSLDQETQDGFFGGASLFDKVRTTRFTGASGYVEFNPDTVTRTNLPRKIVNVIAAPNNNGDGGDSSPALQSTTVARQSRDIAENQLRWGITDVPMVYADGTDNAPLSLPPLEDNDNRIGPGTLALGYALSAAFMVMALAWVAWTVVHRKERVVRRSQPEFLIMLCQGSLIMSSAIIPMGLQEPLPVPLLDAACMTVPWLFQIGFVVSFSALIAKTTRFRMSTQTRRGFTRRIRIKAKEVLVSFLVLFALSATVLSVWTAVSPLNWQRQPLGSMDIYGRPVESFGSCQLSRDVGYVFIVALVAVDIISVALTLFQQYQARNISSEYNEGQYITVSVSSILQAFVLGVPVMYATSTNPSANFLVRAILICVINAAVMMPLFLPKERARRREMKQLKLTSSEPAVSSCDVEGDSSQHSLGSLKPTQKTWSQCVHSVMPMETPSSLESSERSHNDSEIYFDSHKAVSGANLGRISEESNDSSEFDPGQSNRRITWGSLDALAL